MAETNLLITGCPQELELLLTTALPFRRHLHLESHQHGQLLTRAHLLPQKRGAATRVQIVVCVIVYIVV